MRFNVTIEGYVREDGRAQVFMYVSIGGKRAKYPMGFAVEPSRWDKKLRRVRPGRLALEYNRRISYVLEQAEALSLQHGITAQALVDMLRNRSTAGRSFAEVAREDLGKHPPRSWHTVRQRKQRIDQFDRSFPGMAAKEVDASVFARYKAILVAEGVRGVNVSSHCAPYVLRVSNVSLHLTYQRTKTRHEHAMQLRQVGSKGHSNDH